MSQDKKPIENLEEKGYKPRPSNTEFERSNGGYKPKVEKPADTNRPKTPPKKT
jgi:hypothetical protein